MFAAVNRSAASDWAGCTTLIEVSAAKPGAARAAAAYSTLITPAAQGRMRSVLPSVARISRAKGWALPAPVTRCERYCPPGTARAGTTRRPKGSAAGAPSPVRWAWAAGANKSKGAAKAPKQAQTRKIAFIKNKPVRRGQVTAAARRRNPRGESPAEKRVQLFSGNEKHSYIIHDEAVRLFFIS